MRIYFQIKFFLPLIIILKMISSEQDQPSFRPPNLNLPSISDLLLMNCLQQKNGHPDLQNGEPLSTDAIQVKFDNFQKKYEILDPIGQGANGIVSLCRNRQSHMIFAVKVMKIDEQYCSFLKKNYLSVRCFRHQNLVTYKGLYLQNDRNKCYLLMEYKQYPALTNAAHLNQEELNQIAKQILSGLKYLHKKKFIHRDIKPDNILYDRKSGKILIIDFGVGRKVTKSEDQKKLLSVTGSPRYRAPQVICLRGYSNKVDMWSLGITLYELVCGKLPFEVPNLHDPEVKTFAKKPEFKEKKWQNISKELKDFITRLLKISPQGRLSAADALEHVWFKKQIKKEAIGNRNCQSSKEEDKDLMFLTFQGKKQSKCEPEEGGQLISGSVLVNSDEEEQGIVQNGKLFSPYD